MKLQCGARVLDLAQPAVMGILNLTEDSFSDGAELLSGSSAGTSTTVDGDAVLRRADAMVEAGASILDLGAESTRPGAVPVPLPVERDRILAGLELLAPRFDVVLSVDSSSPEVFTDAAAAGAGLLNDVRALQRAGALEAAAATKLPVCLMHMQGEPGTMQVDPVYTDVCREVRDFLVQRAQACREVGMAPERIVLDPGFGFGKTLEHNLALLEDLGDLCALGHPVLVGVSRKSMIGALTGRAVGERATGSAVAAALAVAKGASIIRAHDVGETLDAVRIAAAVREAGQAGRGERGT